MIVDKNLLNKFLINDKECLRKGEQFCIKTGVLLELLSFQELIMRVTMSDKIQWTSALKLQKI